MSKIEQPNPDFGRFRGGSQMRIWKRWLLVLCLTVLGGAQAPGPSYVPQLQAGEGLAVAGPDGIVQLYGEAQKEAPMGSIAKLAWLRLEGDDWATQDLVYKCTGQMGPYHCWLPKGHGKVDLAKATQESCNLAYLTWAQRSLERWKREIGEGAGRALFEETFSPFLGRRLPPGDTLPALTPEWIGDGELLRTSPEAMLQWLLDPAQEMLLSRCRRLLLGAYAEQFKPDAWWMKTGTAPVISDPSATSAWVVGSNGRVFAVLHLPRGRGKAEGLARFQALMGISAKS
jgi:hypothetical protein